MVRQACIRGMWEGEFTEEVEWMSWVLEDQGVGDMQRWGRDRGGQSMLEALQSK